LLLYEPLNRYETNLLNRLEDARDFVETLTATNVRLLADLFHMNIEERSLPEAISRVGLSIGHVHWVDSNRRPAGLGHLNLSEVATALRGINYSGYVSAEALPYPNSEEAARQTLVSFKELFHGALPRPEGNKT
jgi:sugar phosphate isomerase/epimerase